MFTPQKANIVVSGVGLNEDNTGWAVKQDDYEWVRINYLGVWTQRSALIYGLFAYLALIFTLLGILGYIIWLIVSGNVIINPSYFQQLVSNFWFWVVLVWIFGVVRIFT